LNCVQPLIRHVTIDEDRAHRTYDDALFTFDADFRVDVVLGGVGNGVDTRDRTHFDTRAIFHADAGSVMT